MAKVITEEELESKPKKKKMPWNKAFKLAFNQSARGVFRGHGGTRRRNSHSGESARGRVDDNYNFDIDYDDDNNKTILVTTKTTIRYK